MKKNPRVQKTNEAQPAMAPFGHPSGRIALVAVIFAAIVKRKCLLCMPCGMSLGSLLCSTLYVVDCFSFTANSRHRPLVQSPLTHRNVQLGPRLLIQARVVHRVVSVYYNKSQIASSKCLGLSTFLPLMSPVCLRQLYRILQNMAISQLSMGYNSMLRWSTGFVGSIFRHGYMQYIVWRWCVAAVAHL